MKPRWKMKADLVDFDRQQRVTLALYGEDNMPIARYVVRFSEHATPAEVATELRALANLVETGPCPFVDTLETP